MTKEEALKMLRKDSLSNLVNYYSSKEIQDAIDAIVSKPPLPSDLDKAAEKYASNRAKDPEQCYEYLYYEIIDAVRFGAELMAGQGYSQEEVVEDKSIEVGYGVLPGISPIINLPDSFKPGDKVIIQIRKKQ